MWVLGSLAFLVPGMAITWHLLRPSRLGSRLTESEPLVAKKNPEGMAL